MSTYDDSLLATRFTALAPEPLPGDWADVLCRSGVAQQKPWRLGRFGAFGGRRRRRLLVLAAAALVVVVATASAIGSVRDFILDRGFIGLPPVRATASDLLRDKSRTRSEGDVVASPEGGGPVAVQGRLVKDCYRLTTEEAREAAEALSGLDPDPGWGMQYGLAYRVAEGNNWWEGTGVSFEPYFPDGRLPFAAPSG
jgi:hypothetical protein